MSAADAAASPPLLQVVRGTPTPEELAALIAVVAARGAGGASDAAPPSPAWCSRARLVRSPVHAGPGGWRASAHPL